MGIYSVVSSVASVAEANAQWKAIQRQQSVHLSSEQIFREASARLTKSIASIRSKNDQQCKPTGAKCQSCGSHEYVRSSVGVICSYCRTPESGIRIRYQHSYHPSSDQMLTRYDTLYGSAVLLPDVAVRIKE